MVEVNLTQVPGAPSQNCFVSSYKWCSKKQVLDLVEEGLWPELLDSGKIEICVSGGEPETTMVVCTDSLSSF